MGEEKRCTLTEADRQRLLRELMEVDEQIQEEVKEPEPARAELAKVIGWLRDFKPAT